jgi:hypothetical protein
MTANGTDPIRGPMIANIRKTWILERATCDTIA